MIRATTRSECRTRNYLCVPQILYSTDESSAGLIVSLLDMLSRLYGALYSFESGIETFVLREMRASALGQTQPLKAMLFQRLL